MEGLEVQSIPVKTLARILVHLPTIPTHTTNDLVPILSAGLANYGHTSDMNAFLDYCKSSVSHETPWLWEQIEINKEADWDIANNKKQQELIGIRFLLNSETTRQSVEIARFAKHALYDPRCIHFYQGRAFSVDTILNDTLDYFRKEKEGIDPLVEKLIGLRLNQFNKDKDAFERQSNELDHADYHLMGALMVRYDGVVSRGHDARSWCLYLRDFVTSEDGSAWRILVDEDEEKVVTSDQAIADIRGSPNECSEFSKAYRPVYLFYVNLDILQRSQQRPEDHVITLDDYTFDDEYEPLEQTTEEDEICMRCGIQEIVSENDMFFCESCNRGVHQLCEDPPIQAFEKDVDPWYCRKCCRMKGIPIPTAPTNNSPSSKRKREDDDHSR